MFDFPSISANTKDDIFGAYRRERGPTATAEPSPERKDHRAAAVPFRTADTFSRLISQRSPTRSQTNEARARKSNIFPSRFLPTTRNEMAVETCIPSRLNRKSSSFGRIVNWLKSDMIFSISERYLPQPTEPSIGAR